MSASCSVTVLIVSFYFIDSLSCSIEVSLLTLIGFAVLVGGFISINCALSLVAEVQPCFEV